MILRPKTISSSGDGGAPRHRLRLGAAHDEWNHVAIALVAMEEGFFAAEGLTEVELITFGDSSGELLDREKIQVDLLTQGVVDIGIDPRASFVLQAKDRKLPVCIVAARRKNHAFVLVGRKGLRDIHELRGATIKMGHPGGATDVMMRQVLKDSGLEPDKDFKISYVGGAMHDLAGVAQAFVDGEYGPAFLAKTAEADRLVADGYPVLADLGRLYPSRHDRVTAANENFCRSRPDLLKGFLKGMIRGCRYVLDAKNRERFKEIIIAAGFMTTERERHSFDGLLTAWYERISVDLSLPADGVELIVKEQKQAGNLSPSFETEDVLRLEALHAAQRELAAHSAPPLGISREASAINPLEEALPFQLFQDRHIEKLLGLLIFQLRIRQTHFVDRRLDCGLDRIGLRRNGPQDVVFVHRFEDARVFDSHGIAQRLERDFLVLSRHRGGFADRHEKGLRLGTIFL